MTKNKLVIQTEKQIEFNKRFKKQKTPTEWLVSIVLELGELMNEDPINKPHKIMEWNIKDASKELADVWILLLGSPFVDVTALSFLELTIRETKLDDNYKINIHHKYLDIMHSLVTETWAYTFEKVAVLTKYLITEWKMTADEFFKIMEEKSTYNETRVNFDFKDKGGK